MGDDSGDDENSSERRARESADEVSPTARGVAASLHSCFFYLGQATGPLVYGFGFGHAGEAPTLLVGAVMVLMVGFVCARLLRHRHTTGSI